VGFIAPQEYLPTPLTAPDQKTSNLVRASYINTLRAFISCINIVIHTKCGQLPSLPKSSDIKLTTA